jgi:hypothetical protein
VRVAGALLALCAVLACSGCIVIGATVATVAAVTTVTVKTAGKVTVATVETTGRIATAAVTSSGGVTAMSMESAAKLAKTGMVVVVNAGSGTTAELPWQQGMQLYSAAQAGKFGGTFNAARIFRDGKILSVNLNQTRAAEQALRSGDVVELRR